MNTQTAQTLKLPQPELARQFLLDDDIVFLNHGSFGACPRPVFEQYQYWQRELERQPVNFIARRLPDLLAEARQALAKFINAPADNLTFVPNATYGINVVVRSLDLQPEDEVLTTDHEYGAINNTWNFNRLKRGFKYIHQPIPLPVTSADDFVEQLWRGVTPRTKVIAISHITSPTALIFPVAEICRRAREEGIVTIVDGAHALGQIDLDMQAIGATYYTGNGHKWLCSPKGSAFLYVAPGYETLLEPLVVSHGWVREEGSRFLNNFVANGTMDPSAYLSVPAAIKFQIENDWHAVRAACHQLAVETRDRVNALTGLESISPASPEWFAQMFVARLPQSWWARAVETLWPKYKIEMPLPNWNGNPLLRCSIQAYNSPEHMNRLLDALEEIGRETDS